MTIILMMRQININKVIAMPFIHSFPPRTYHPSGHQLPTSALHISLKQIILTVLSWSLLLHLKHSTDYQLKIDCETAQVEIFPQFLDFSPPSSSVVSRISSLSVGRLLSVNLISKSRSPAYYFMSVPPFEFQTVRSSLCK